MDWDKSNVSFNYIFFILPKEEKKLVLHYFRFVFVFFKFERVIALKYVWVM